MFCFFFFFFSGHTCGFIVGSWRGTFHPNKDVQGTLLFFLRHSARIRLEFRGMSESGAGLNQRRSVAPRRVTARCPCRFV
uniref:Putative secreted protein synganglion overexpressed n=1 Tax=Rhipicephalus microplus TaxID=6941 RepID=A0A6M2DDN4_RHIMP